MATINEQTKDAQFKFVYCGPGHGGKTSNLGAVHAGLGEAQRGELISLSTSTDRTLYFDFLPVNPVNIRGYHVRFQLYTTPGQVCYGATRQLVLRGVDGIIFVADSQIDRDEANDEAMQSLYETLEARGCDVSRLPFVIQYNKRDLPGIVPVEQLRARLNPAGVPDFESVATEGKGVFETLAAVSRLVVKSLR